ncbi:hypothetical protein [Streptomyces lycii]|uniref:Uncharacterized protein n=1 Tax=Streptomyces lycii TaxID=2654337 RepID=A0ABQ7FFW5_9ACTN|nr:hypothetical protein [Streptomyces lycii]KAF4406549.1 hypothetical protein GCU69_24410 [Streptomyces lycii]
MSDLYIDMDMLDRVQCNIKRISELMKKPGREMKKVDGSSMGAAKLAERMDEFGDEWSYGIERLGKFSQSDLHGLDVL